MIKYLLTSGSALLFSVGFLYYLVQNSNFAPMAFGNYQWVNILVFFYLLLLGLFCLCNLIIFGLRKWLFKEIPEGVQIRRSIRYSILLTLGFLIVYLLHFYHILSFWWGLGILIVVILAIFVI